MPRNVTEGHPPYSFKTGIDEITLSSPLLLRDAGGGVGVGKPLKGLEVVIGLEEGHEFEAVDSSVSVITTESDPPVVVESSSKKVVRVDGGAVIGTLLRGFLRSELSVDEDRAASASSSSSSAPSSARAQGGSPGGEEAII
jgi:hypothetical protein